MNDRAEEAWTYTVPKAIVEYSYNLVTYLVSSKFNLYSTSLASERQEYDWHGLKRVLHLPNALVTTTHITHAHICKPIERRYTRESAIHLMEQLEALQLA